MSPLPSARTPTLPLVTQAVRTLGLLDVGNVGASDYSKEETEGYWHEHTWLHHVRVHPGFHVYLEGMYERGVCSICLHVLGVASILIGMYYWVQPETTLSLP